MTERKDLIALVTGLIGFGFGLGLRPIPTIEFPATIPLTVSVELAPELFTYEQCTAIFVCSFDECAKGPNSIVRCDCACLYDQDDDGDVDLADFAREQLQIPSRIEKVTRNRRHLLRNTSQAVLSDFWPIADLESFQTAPRAPSGGKADS